MTETYFHAVVLAGGKGSRLGGTPKQYRQLHGQDVWLYAILALASHPRCR
ncbi:MAG: NTP transferase domain-containing protein, partial [Candidatus Puniceispirillales bacterium]